MNILYILIILFSCIYFHLCSKWKVDCIRAPCVLRSRKKDKKERDRNRKDSEKKTCRKCNEKRLPSNEPKEEPAHRFCEDYWS